MARIIDARSALNADDREWQTVSHVENRAVMPLVGDVGSSELGETRGADAAGTRRLLVFSKLCSDVSGAWNAGRWLGYSL